MDIIKIGVMESNFNCSGLIYSVNGIAPTIRAYAGGNLEPKILVKNNDQKDM